MIKGFVLNDDLLKNAGQGNYFDELLARIRDIRSSECSIARCWRVLTNDSFTTSVFCAGLKFWQIKKALKIK